MLKKLPYTIGFELESFLFKGNLNLVSARDNDFPTDGDNLLVEFRGEPSNDIFQAGYSIRALVAQYTHVAKERNLAIIRADWYDKTSEGYQTLMSRLVRKYGYNKSINWQSLYGLEPSKKNLTHHSAGFHVSIRKEQSIYCAKTDKANADHHKYGAPIDFVQPFLKIEREFAKEIEASERTKGFYEMKTDGRYEYRSLPATIFTDDFEQRLYNALLGEQ